MEDWREQKSYGSSQNPYPWLNLLGHLITLTFFLSLAFVLSSGILTAMTVSLHSLGRLQGEEWIKKPSFFFVKLYPFFIQGNLWESTLFALSFTKHILRIGYICSAIFFFLQISPFSHAVSARNHEVIFQNGLLVVVVLLITIVSLLIDILFSILGREKAEGSFSFLSPIASLLLAIHLPITAPFYRLMQFLLPKKQGKIPHLPSAQLREKVLELLKQSEVGAYLDATEQQFILSILSFKERIVREVMVPRIQLFSLDVRTLVKDAARNFIEEGYSRIPVYRENVDNIVGVLYYKDLLKLYVHPSHAQDPGTLSIEKIAKPILYAPETKKIAQLLQEFRNKQIHLAIVVNEWGGTEGIVTIEDILEELVGEIADEFDVGQPLLYTPIPSGGWIVDAKMAIVDIQEELRVKIPLNPEYDTIGGYVFHRAGSIPSKGWRIHHDDFDLEVLSSNERTIEKIKIIPH